MAEKDLVYRGKSKDVFKITSGKHKGKYRFVFTDRATGYIETGKTVFDPGYDTVVGDIPGKGAIACRFATHFFKLLKAKGVPTHYIDTINDNEMIVEPAIPLSMPVEGPGFPGSAPLLNLEFTWRNNATGSFWRRYPFVKPCKNLHKVVEAWTKGDSDILITLEALEETGALTKKEIAQSVKLVKKIAEIVSQEFASKKLHVIDGKFELGVCRGFKPDKAGNCSLFKKCTNTSYYDGKRIIKNKNQVSAAEFINIFL